jgi:hypothetical protein
MGGNALTGRVLIILLLLACLLLGPTALQASPVEWREVPATAAGRQWWDGGSLRINGSGNLSVLSRFQPAAEPEATSPGATSPGAASPGARAGGRRTAGTLYVMEIDCAQELFRDTSVNGLPRFRAEWQPAAGDDLTSSVLHAACAAAADRLAAVTP